MIHWIVQHPAQFIFNFLVCLLAFNQYVYDRKLESLIKTLEKCKKGMDDLTRSTEKFIQHVYPRELN